MLSKPWHENVKLWHPKCHSAASYEVSARPRSIYTCQNVHVIKLPRKVKLNSPWSWFLWRILWVGTWPAPGFCVPKSLDAWMWKKNISLSVQVSAQDLYICPPDRGKRIFIKRFVQLNDTDTVCSSSRRRSILDPRLCFSVTMPGSAPKLIPIISPKLCHGFLPI